MDKLRQGTGPNKRRKLYKFSSSDDDPTDDEDSFSPPPKKQAKSSKAKSHKPKPLPSKKPLKSKIKSPKPPPKTKVEKEKSKTKLKQEENNESETKNLKVKPLDKKNLEPLWQEHEILASEHNLSSKIAGNIVELLKDGNTIPFIARYRKEAIGQMSPDELRSVKDTYENALELKNKIVSVYGKVYDMGKMNDKLARNILDVKNFDTLEELYAPFKPVAGEASTKRQIQAALEEATNLIMEGYACNLNEFVGKAPKLDSLVSVEKHIVPAVAKKIASSAPILKLAQTLKNEGHFKLETKKIKKRPGKEEKNFNGAGKTRANKSESNFTDYYDRVIPTHLLKPHQVMAINRAEHLKFINVNIIVNDFYNQFCAEVNIHWKQGFIGPMRAIFNEALPECYNHIVIPLVKRLKRSELKIWAEKASLGLFGSNLKQILLAAPVKGRPILGVDPGFSHGCKLGLVNETGNVLATDVVYPHTGDRKKRQGGENLIKELLLNHRCSLIAIGNGTACRETESWITDMISRNVFAPLEVSYTIVNENGASIYSVSKEASKEFKTMDPNKISAVSLARRIQEPLAELVKIEPKHLGIGMYQHDVNQKRLEETLSETVSECVSFVGIDLNTASQCLLKYVAGLTDRRASEIIIHREQNGLFNNREQLLKVKGIGPHTFKQCAGFLKIVNIKGADKLDATIVHPESYTVAKEIIKFLNLRQENIGDDSFINTIKRVNNNLLKKVEMFGTNKENMEVVLEGLSKPLTYDLRDDGNRQPLFRQGVTSMSALNVGMELTGSVNNKTSFGFFVDVGVGTDGLIHVKFSKGVDLQIGDHVEVKVSNLDVSRGRIGLELLQKL